MRAIIRNSVLAIIAAAVLGGGVAYGQGSLSERGTLDGSAPARTPGGNPPLGIGDKLKIAFYETIDLGAGKQNGRDGAEPRGPLRTYYQRMDLGGDYTVEQDGAISIPLLGRFPVEGRNLDDVRADLAVSFTTVIGRSANLDVRILDRSPIYVVGRAKNPGAYKYVPGMIVLQAIALAGGLDRGEGSVSGMIEGTREMERLRSASVQIKQLLARRARLEAERDGISTLPIPVQLTSSAGERTTRTFLATENAILRAEQARRRQQEKEIASRVAAARKEVEARKRKIDQVDAQRNLRTERLDDLQKLKDRGLVSSNTVLTLRSELADIEGNRQDYLVAVLQAETRLAEAEGASVRLASENTANLANAIAAVDREITATQETMTSSSILATVLNRSNSGGLRAESFEIVRQSKEGAMTLQATETSLLMPGDVLKINSDMAPTATPGSFWLPQPELATPHVRRTVER